jgi:hypothetical protein
MKEEINNKSQITRRGFLPLLGGGVILPLFGFGQPNTQILGEKEEYQTLLKPDGTTVHVKKSVVEKSKIVEKNISNESLLVWLKKSK